MIFVHSGVSDERVAAIARFGAEMVRVDGSYDHSVREAAEVAAERGWTVVSDTSWPGYERIPGLVMQGYTVIVREALRHLPKPPTHVFLQAGVGGIRGGDRRSSGDRARRGQADGDGGRARAGCLRLRHRRSRTSGENPA